MRISSSISLPVLVAAMFIAPAAIRARDSREPDYLEVVRAYADALIEHGRDVYGEQETPLFAAALDRRTMQLLEGEALERVRNIRRRAFGIRPDDRTLQGANPQHDQNLYQVLYALTAITGEQRWAREADRALKFFFENGQAEATGLMYWGEHAGWDFRTDAPDASHRHSDTHEFFRPWVLWERSWELAPEACARFAMGLWENQIGDKRTGDFSRHARLSSRGPGRRAAFPRHAGFYIETWAYSYRKTQDETFLEAIRVVLVWQERERLWRDGMLVCTRPQRVPHSIGWAVSLENAAAMLSESPPGQLRALATDPRVYLEEDIEPESLAELLRAVAGANDESYKNARAAAAERPAADAAPRDLWSSAYGSGYVARGPNILMLRYRQTGLDVYRQRVLAVAGEYTGQEIGLDGAVWPGAVGGVIFLMLNAYELTGEEKYLDEADRFARGGIELFLSDGPLPRASHRHVHYEAVTNGDTLMMALLRLWLIRQPAPHEVNLVYTDR